MGVTAHAPRTLGVYQVRDFFPGAREETIGPATGSLASAFNLAQLATSFAWGWAADVSGRPKALILLANVVCGAGSTAFALTTSYGGAMAARVVAGAFMTSGVVMKALIGTTLSKDAQAIAMAYRTLGAGLAQILTPIVIGQLANPCRRGFRVGGCGQGGFLATRPYALSGAFIAAVGVAATAVNFFMVPDVRTAHGVPVDGAPGGSGEGCGWPCCARRRTAAAGKGTAPPQISSCSSNSQMAASKGKGVVHPPGAAVIARTHSSRAAARASARATERGGWAPRADR